MRPCQLPLHGAVTLEGNASVIAGDPRVREAYLGE